MVVTRTIRSAVGQWLASLFLLCAGTALAQSPSPQAAPVAAADTVAASADAGLAKRVPPASITDLTTLLKSYRPDAQRIARLRSVLEAPLAPGQGAAQMAVALHTQANAAEELQEVELRVQLLEAALGHANQVPDAADGQVGGKRRIRFELAAALRPAQGVAASLDSCLAFASDLESSKDQSLGWLVGLYQHIAKNYVLLGDVDKARSYLGRLDQALVQLGRRKGNALRMPNWQRQAESIRGEVLLAQGRLGEAESAFLAALRQGEEAMGLLATRQARGLFARSEQRSESGLDDDRIRLATTYLAQNRVDESELLLREVLKRSLARDGRNSILVGKVLTMLARVMLARDRSAEAVVLAQWAEQTMAEAGMAELSPPRANGQVVLANALMVQGQASQAVAIIDRLRQKLGNDARVEEGFGRGTLQTIRAYMLVGRLQDALADGDSLLLSRSSHYGAQHYETAEARAYRAMVLQRLGRLDEAGREFEQATAVLLDPSKISGRQQTSPTRIQRLRLILGEYLTLLSGRKASNRPDDIAKAFMLADVARWQSVQKAVSGSAIRSAAGSAELAARIKKVQDADDEIQAVYKNLISQRSAPPDKQLPSVIRAMEQRIATLQAEQLSDLEAIRRQFPQYDALVNPKPADVGAARKALQRTEALLSVFMNPQGTYVWALGGDGKLHFHFSPQSTQWVAERVKKLRASVDLTAGTPAQQLQFDLQAGLELYQELFAPVASAWAQADTLIVVANDALGQIPFSMLPTRAPAELSAENGVALSQFRQIAWLVRQVAVAYVPSVSSLVAMRALPTAQRERAAFIGFGDPDFGQVLGAGTSRAATRGLRNLSVSRNESWSDSTLQVDISPTAQAVMVQADDPAAPEPNLESQPQAQASAAVSVLLPALPDTRDEIIAIAQALQANVERDAFFGQQASPARVMQMDLRKRKVIAFATHGLMAGDLPGLDQPALALSPDQGQAGTDGLLRLEDILKLSLDADLVVLSACNTAAADGAGSEAVSGLGRGFFYAGARSVLATHWPVETVSARELVTHLFQGYSRDPQMTRARALRNTMLKLLDQGGTVDARGNLLLSYAHPAFWAPYALYGDPGR